MRVPKVAGSLSSCTQKKKSFLTPENLIRNSTGADFTDTSVFQCKLPLQGFFWDESLVYMVFKCSHTPIKCTDIVRKLGTWEGSFESAVKRFTQKGSYTFLFEIFTLSGHQIAVTTSY